MPELKPEKALIEKKTLHPGTKPVDFRDGTKVHFHFQTRLCDPEHTVIDDSRKLGHGKPLDLILGKKFKLEVWEAILQKLALSEVASFTVDKSLVLQYPFVSKTIRDHHKPNHEHRAHMCAMTVQTQGVGYGDLDKLIKYPQDLEFIFELVKVEQPDDYEKESWQMDETEKLEMVPVLRELGNKEYKEKNYQQAADHYARAIAHLEELLIKEKPHEEEWNNYNKMKVPLLLNYAQCKLSMGDFYPVIEHCTTALQTDPDNVKAYYRRAKAHVQVWNTSEALEDFKKAMQLDPSLTNSVKKEIAALEEAMRKKDSEDKDKLKGLFN